MRTDQVEKVLTALGIEPDYVRDDEVFALCPGHLENTGREDTRASWSVNAESGVHFCFSCGFSGNLVSLVVLRQPNMVSAWGFPDWDKAKTWIADLIGDDVSDIHQRLADVTNAYVNFSKPVPMTEARLAVFSDPPEWALKNRALTRDSVNHYGILWSEPDVWITPIRYPDTHVLMGWQEKGEGRRYFNNRPPSVKKSTTLFGLNVWDDKRMVVVESPLDAARLHSAGISGGVATMGAMVSEAQLLLMMASTDLIIAMDNPAVDAAGAKAARNILDATRRMAFECRFFNYGKSGAKDIGDMTVREVLHGVQTAKHSVFGEKAFSA